MAHTPHWMSIAVQAARAQIPVGCSRHSAPLVLLAARRLHKAPDTVAGGSAAARAAEAAGPAENGKPFPAGPWKTGGPVSHSCRSPGDYGGSVRDGDRKSTTERYRCAGVLAGCRRRRPKSRARRLTTGCAGVPAGCRRRRPKRRAKRLTTGCAGVPAGCRRRRPKRRAKRLTTGCAGVPAGCRRRRPGSRARRQPRSLPSTSTKERPSASQTSPERHRSAVSPRKPAGTPAHPVGDARGSTGPSGAPSGGTTAGLGRSSSRRGPGSLDRRLPPGRGRRSVAARGSAHGSRR